jgi:hypothetical protein
MEEIISQKEFEEIKKIPGEIRGLALKGEVGFILKKKGETGLKRLKEAMANYGYPIEYFKVREMGFSPLATDVLHLVLMKKLFNFDDKDFEELGEFYTKVSFLFRLFAKYLVSLERATAAVPLIWKRYQTSGQIAVTEIQKEKKYAILRIDNFSPHPIYCPILRGVFSNMLKLVINVPKVTAQETKCPFRGDEYYEILLKW